MKKLSFLALFAMLFLGGCHGEWWYDDYDTPDQMTYSGDIFDCEFKGDLCVDSSYCVVTRANNYGVGEVQCNYDGWHYYGYDYLYFTGNANYCYFNGVSCISTSQCDRTRYNEIECWM